MCSQGVLRYHYLQAFSTVDTRALGIKSDWCSYGIRAIYGILAVLRATPVVVGHTSGGGLSSYRSSWGLLPQTPLRRARKLRARLEKYARLSAVTFSA